MIRSLFISLALVTWGKAAVLYQTISVFPEGNVFILDFNLDSVADVRIDIGAAAGVVSTSDPYYLAIPLGSSLIANEGEITRSFSVGEFVNLGNLAFVGSAGSLMTGGVYWDTLGNTVAEGWGGVTADATGKWDFPSEGPTHQIDLFLVKLDQGVAWVDLDSSVFSAISGRIDVRWGYMEGANDSFTITGFSEPTAIPEPSSSLLIGLGALGLLRRRRES